MHASSKWIDRPMLFPNIILCQRFMWKGRKEAVYNVTFSIFCSFYAAPSLRRLIQIQYQIRPHSLRAHPWTNPAPALRFSGPGPKLKCVALIMGNIKIIMIIHIKYIFSITLKCIQKRFSTGVARFVSTETHQTNRRNGTERPSQTNRQKRYRRS